MNGFLAILASLLFLVMMSRVAVDLPLPGNLNPVPLTGQSLAVCVSAILLPRTSGTLVMLIYLLLGAVGFPVFADGAAGFSHLTGPTAGYLLAFLLVPFLVGETTNKSWTVSFLSAFVASCLATLFILALGCTVLAFHIGLGKAITHGFLPFLLPGAIKALMAAGIVRVLVSIKSTF